MEPRDTVEIADRYSRKRVVVVIAAALAFFAIHVVLRPFFYTQRAGIDWWAVNAIVLLACLATGGGILNRRSVRRLVNDEVARSHYRTAVVAGYWVAMTAAIAIYFVSLSQGITARGALYVVVTAGILVPLLTFSALEIRAHRDA
jgi:hypothetical protein